MAQKPRREQVQATVSAKTQAQVKPKGEVYGLIALAWCQRYEEKQQASL